MSKQKPPQGREPHGSPVYAPTESKLGFNGIISPEVIKAFERELAGIVNGTGLLTVFIKDSRFQRYTIDREQSFVPGKLTTGGINGK
jgi:hypothetical protein